MGGSAVRDFRTLKVWQRAHQLTLKIYSESKHFPREELFGLTSQMRRSSSSIGANIAEGCGKCGEGEFRRFLLIASGSASELDYHLLLARDLNLLTGDLYSSMAKELSEIRKMLTGLRQKADTITSDLKATG